VPSAIDRRGMDAGSAGNGGKLDALEADLVEHFRRRGQDRRSNA